MQLLYDDANHDKVHVAATGNGGIDEVIPLFSDQPGYAYWMSEGGKCLLIAFFPDSLSAMKKVKLQKHKAEISTFLKDVHADVTCMERRDMRRLVESAVDKIRNAMTARN
jgi:hypothetical protein